MCTGGGRMEKKKINTALAEEEERETGKVV